MIIPADPNKPDSKRTKSLSGWLKTVMSIARRLIGSLDLTEEDQEKAGIYLDYDR
jgi:hypothetical protein